MDSTAADIQTKYGKEIINKLFPDRTKPAKTGLIMDPYNNPYGDNPCVNPHFYPIPGYRNPRPYLLINK